MLTSFVLAALIQPAAIPLQRGWAGDADFRYWAVADTFLESGKPNDNFGRDALLSGGPGKVILMRFGDLRRMVGPGRAVSRARLILRQEIGDAPQLAGVFRMMRPWGEGPGRRGMALMSAPIEPGAKAPNVSATWNSPLGGLRNIDWQAPGGKGLADRVEVPGTNGVTMDETYVIDGLGPIVQRMMEDPESNFGFGIEFRNIVDFRSSEARGGRPMLQIETVEAPLAKGGDVRIESVSSSFDDAKALPKDGEAVTWTAKVGYNGPGGSGSLRVVWNFDGREQVSELPNGIPDGFSGTVSVQSSWRIASDPRIRKVTVRVESAGSDVRRDNNAMSFLESAIPVRVNLQSGEEAQMPFEAIRFFNDSVAPFSRFSFALDGASVGLRLASVSSATSTSNALPRTSMRAWLRSFMLDAGVPDLSTQNVRSSANAGRTSVDPYPGITGGGDTRNDEAYPSVLGFPAEPWFDAATAELNFESTDLMAASEAGVLMARSRNWATNVGAMLPKTAVVRMLDGSGQLLRGARLEFFPIANGTVAASPSFAIESTGGGIAPLPVQGATLFPNPGQGVYMVRVMSGAQQATTFLKGWQLIDAFARGNQDAAIIPLRVAMPNRNPSSVNLAAGRILADSRDSLPNVLEALVDDNPATVLKWPANTAGWIEVDLQKDRGIQEVQLGVANSTIWDRFRIAIYSTGQRADSARTWFQEVNGPWMLANRGNGTRIAYFGPQATVRYIRLEIPASPQAVDLSELSIFGGE